MNFTSPQFFLFIIPVFLFSLLLRRKKHREFYLLYLLLVSLFFYGGEKPWYLFLLFWVSFLSYGAGLVAFRMSSGARKWATLLVFLVFWPLLVLKYGRFFLQNFFFLNEVLLGGSQDSGIYSRWIPALAPGISFFTFQSVSYVTEIRRMVAPPVRSLSRFLLYISFFPQLVAGPIVSARRFFPLLERSVMRVDFRGGMWFLLSGFFKKTVLADRLSEIVAPVFDGSNLPANTVILGVFAYSFQIYFDFSGYSDMALGLGRLFGIRLPTNFYFPYGASGFQEFWRRWHITLSIWLRDHIYIPLGGNRMGKVRMGLALLATMVLGGFWHGAHWSFVLWGGLHGLLLILERVFLRKRLSGLFSLFYRFFTFSAVTLLWIPFRAGFTDAPFEKTKQVFHSLFFAPALPVDGYALRLVLFVGVLYSISFFYKDHFARWKIWTRSLSEAGYGVSLALLVLGLVLFSGGGGDFIYFVF